MAENKDKSKAHEEEIEKEDKKDAKGDEVEKDTNEKSGDNEEAPEKNEPEEDEETKYKRLAADFQNYKRRVEKEKSDIYAYANEKITADLLEVLDNFERAIEHDKGEAEDKKFVEGMELILKQFQEVLAKNNVVEINALGEDFDPNLHHAVVMEESNDYDSGKVIDVMQKGYKLKDKVIRPSMVKVAE